MRVLLIPPKNNYPHPGPHVAFGLGPGMPYLAGALKAAGHEVFGANIYHIWCHGSAPLTLERVIREAIKKYQPHLIGVGGMAPHYHFIRDAILFCRQIAPEIPIVCGGGIVTYDAEFIFSNLRLDYAIVGEGELAIVKLADYLDKGGDIGCIPSLVYWKNGKATFNKEEYPENLDELPFPDYDPFDYEAYLSLYNQGNNAITYSRSRPRLMPIANGRSCPYRCTFCSKSTPYRSRSIDNVMEEIAYLYKKYQFNILYATDELFSVKGGKALEFCHKVKALKKELNADFDWICYLRVGDINSDLLKEMREAGCVVMAYGFESASNVVLKSMKKGTKVEQILRAIQLTEEAGIAIHANFIFGDVAETPETINETMEFYQKHCRNHNVQLFYITPYPGSKLFQYCLDKSLVIDRQAFYEDVLHNKKNVNMTSMPDSVFYGLTKTYLSNEHEGEVACVLSCEKADLETCDVDAPFEFRRYFYKIKAICPHCVEQIEYLYPMKLEDKKPKKVLIPHYCTKCTKKILLDISEKISECPMEETPYSKFYQQSLYTNYYTPDNSERIMRPIISTPRLLEAYKNYNIVRYGSSIYGIAHAIGPLDIPELTKDHIAKYQKAGLWVTGSSVAEVVKFIDAKA